MPVRLLALLHVASAVAFAQVPTDDAGAKAKRGKPRITVSKEVTFFTEPLDKDGYVDYVEALNRRLSEGVTAENNANVLFYRALGPRPEGVEQPEEFFRRMGMARSSEKGDYFVRYTQYLEDEPGLTPGVRDFDEALGQQNRATSRPWTSLQLTHVAGWLKANEKPLHWIVEGAKRPQCYSPIVLSPEDSPGGLMGVMLPGVQMARELARALVARAMLRVGEGQVDEAWQDLLSAHRLGRLIGRGPTVIEALVGCAIEAIAAASDLAFIERVRPTPEQVAGYLRDLEKLPPIPDMADKIDLGERVGLLDVATTMSRGDKRALSFLEREGAVERFLTRLGLNAVDWNLVLRNANDWYDRMSAAMKIENYRESRQALAKLEDEMQEQLAELRGDEKLQNALQQAKNSREVISRIMSNTLMSLLLPA
ncbi:MAG: hypothetical protein KY476_22705, partial [Planctomycetes bacterium]|nr:hypothetical protein [Planctomycetota bacterium]